MWPACENNLRRKSWTDSGAHALDASTVERDLIEALSARYANPALFGLAQSLRKQAKNDDEVDAVDARQKSLGQGRRADYQLLSLSAREVMKT